MIRIIPPVSFVLINLWVLAHKPNYISAMALGICFAWLVVAVCMRDDDA